VAHQVDFYYTVYNWFTLFYHFQYTLAFYVTLNLTPMLRSSQPFLSPAILKATKKNASNHKVLVHPGKEIRFELISESEEEFFLTLQSRLPVLTIAKKQV